MRKSSFFLTSLTLAGLSIGCSTLDPKVSSDNADQTSQESVEWETPQVGEKTVTEALINQIMMRLRGKRDAHPKAHGCVAARVDINPDLAPEHKVGFFADVDADSNALGYGKTNTMRPSTFSASMACTNSLYRQSWTILSSS